MVTEKEQTEELLSKLFCLKLDKRSGHLGWSHTIFLITTTPQERVHKEGKTAIGQDLHHVRLDEKFQAMDLENGLCQPVSKFFNEHPNAAWMLLELSATLDLATGYEFRSRVLQWAEK